LRSGLPVVVNELEALGMARGAKFDEIIEQVFAAQLTGRGKTPEEREKILRKLSGIKEQPKKKEKEKKPAKSGEKPQTTADAGAAGKAGQAAAAKAAQKQQHKEHLTAGQQQHAKKHAAPASAAKSAAPAKRSHGRK